MSAQAPMMGVGVSMGLFQKSLQDLVKGIRANKRDPSSFISQAIAEIKQELKSTDPFVKAQAIRKLTYLQMIGYDVSWASFSIVEVMSQSRFAHKRIGYLAACQSFTESTDVVLLTTNLFKKEFISQNQYDVGLAVNCVANIITKDLAKDLISDMVTLMSHPRPYVRKKALLAMYKLFTKYPQGLRLTFDRLKERLEDPDSSVVSCAVNVICELANKNPRNYLAMAPKFFRLLTTSSNNWMLIKVVKLLGSLVSEEPRLARKLLEPLATIIQNTHAKSLQYECIHTCTLALPHTKREDGTEARNVPQVVRLCAEHLRMFTEDPDQNLKYLGLVGFVNLMHSHPRVVVEHRELVLRCLNDDDVTIRTRALELLTGMVTRRSLADLVTQLLTHVKVAEGMYRDELISKIMFMCSRDKYAFLTDFAWYMRVLCELATVEGSQHGQYVAEQIMEVALRVDTIRAYSVEVMTVFVLDGELLLGQRRDALMHVFKAAAWVVGEYSEYLIDIVNDTKLDMVTDDDDDEGVYWIEGPNGEEMRSQHRGKPLHSLLLEALTHPRVTNLHAHVQVAYIQAAVKIFIRACMDCSPEHLRLCIDVLETRLGVFLQSMDLEVQERASTFRHMLSEFEILKFETLDGKEDADGLNGNTNGTSKSSATAEMHVPATSNVALINLLDPFESLVETAHTHIHTLLALDNKDGVTVAKQKARTLFACVCEPFYIVNPKAQKRVPVPEGLDLDTALNRTALDKLLNSSEPETGKELTTVSFSNIPVGDVTIRIVGMGSDGSFGQTLGEPGNAHTYMQQLTDEDKRLGEVIGETFADELSASNQTTNSYTSTQVEGSNKRSKETELFYLGGGSKGFSKDDGNDIIPMIRLNDADFAARPEDFVGGPRKGKKSKKSSKSRDKASRVAVNTNDVMPKGFGEGSSDDDRKPSRKGKKRGGKEDDIDLRDVDITTPLREDEVIPETKHRQSNPYPNPNPNPGLTANADVAEAKGSNGDGVTKGSKKKKKGSKSKGQREVDLMQFEQAPAQTEPPPVSSSNKKAVWMPLANSPHLQAQYSYSSVPSPNPSCLCVYLRIRGTCPGPDGVIDLRCVPTALPNGYDLQGAGSTGILLAARVQASADFEASCPVLVSKSASGATGPAELTFTLKYNLDALIQQTAEIRCVTHLPSCCFFVPYEISQQAFMELMSTGNWVDTKVRLQYSGGKTKTVLKAIGSYLNSHVIEIDSRNGCYCSRTPQGQVVCVLAKKSAEGIVSVEVRVGGGASPERHPYVAGTVATDLSRLEL